MIKISVIISVFNKQNHILRTLNSVVNQTYKDFKIIVINDGSTDNSLALLKQIKDSRLNIFNQQNLGASAARNRGIKEANTEFIALLDGDDVWLPNYLEEMVTIIKKYPQEYIYSCAIANTYNNRIVPVSYSFKDNELLKIRPYFKNSTNGYTLLTSSSVIFKKNILSKTGKFNVSIKSGEDTDMWIRFGMHYNIVFLNKVLAHYIYNTNSLSNTSFNVSTKPKFDNYYIEESQNKDLKAFIDKNRFSLAILARLNKNKTGYTFYKSGINLSNLRTDRRLLLHCPAWFLKLLLRLKSLKEKKIYYLPLKPKKFL